ncbi:hypothetical protein BIT28_06490 [Photobacterium proteolyticum]|uniref:Peptidase C58 YopT-type domain-containing protein n=1 Tax=Photobacterium proteolyticum TaxID=1903952 RepID=A0A1Q9GEK8_9GAMM|nr:YopT-type cysteine protease domain-containing protein [Photobacterium proteolyticum]OLQ72830.1 hypothetical protein BIT28_06490 [Photobacterium proteolyticum]
MKDTAKNRQLIEKAVYLYKIAFSNAAKSCNAKVRYASQHSILWGAMGPNGFDPDFWKGLCAGLAIEWMKAQKQGRDLILNLDTARTDVFTLAAGERQHLEAIKDDIERSHYQQNTLVKALDGICSPSGNNDSSLYPFNNACSVMKPGRMYYMSSGSHAIAAIYLGTNNIIFYDPNVGEMHGATKKAFQNYLKSAADSSCQVQGIPITSIKGKKAMSIIECI